MTDAIINENISLEPMDCRRCGVCCTLHQSWVRPPEIERIAAYQGITVLEWEDTYLDSRWDFNDYRLVRHVDGACAFLTFTDGLAACTIQEVKPDCCEAWQAGLDKKECRAGLEKKP
ncbi:MAG: YkgJ family cysteine cluster protein [Dehalococcoidales bacterium]|nr:YkgJ family cysteine cluster protein [Dehalococcoidales bacterium]